MTVRERINELVDEGSFCERGLLTGVPTYDETKEDELVNLVPCPFVMGIAKIAGNVRVFVGPTEQIYLVGIGCCHTQGGTIRAEDAIPYQHRLGACLLE